ncbi:CoA-disulfide reductase [Paenibacillus donghaensis]|uniref:CoA-disulfide reductase n=1 Tax=Paenibacillus donghaensis TaxID=414771 RepID=A0A2Z2KCE7_9BACL|nr:CoA-disulfide reductase [Paenibacillus donghaensis]ASA20650.1 CoA-disulfide reductase [Paenibacillus donghaensis]
MSRKSRKVVIIGGVAGGASAAARLRRLNEDDEIIMFERGEHVSFANCGLPYYIGGAIDSREKLFVQTPKGIRDRFNIDVRVFMEVTEINRELKQVKFRNTLNGEEGRQSYDILILSPGARPVMPDIRGLAEADNLFTLRNIPDTDKIKAYVDDQNPEHATVIGAGFIGLEMAENLRERGMAVTIIDRGSQLLGPLDPEMAKPVEQHMKQHGVKIRLNEDVKACRGKGKLLDLSSGETIRTDLIIMAIGVIPENELARDSGLELGFRGAIRVNEALQTSDPSIYAVGDAIEVKDRIQGFATMVSLAWGANRQGRLAADHINGREVSYDGALGTAIIKTFGLTSAATGNNEKTLVRLGVPYEVIHIHPNSHAGYYPGGAPISIKLLFHPQNGTIYGAQAVGPDGVDKRIDVLATAIRAGLSVQELADLELAYAPPYSSAKDPVNMAGYVASNVIDGSVRTIQWHEVDAFVENGGVLIDVRDAIERQAGFIPGSLHIPLAELRTRLSEIPQQHEIAVSCQVGLRGYIAARMLTQKGYEVKNLDGGYKTYAVMKRENGGNGRMSLHPEQPASSQQPPDTVETSPVPSADHSLIVLDACGLQCPGPILKVYEAVQGMDTGDRLQISATDFGFAMDIEQWCLKTGNVLESLDVTGGKVQAVLSKGGGDQAISTHPSAVKEGATLIVFSGDLDKAIASFILASGAAAMGKQVTMFFTFWGLNLLRKDEGPRIKKRGIDRMFGLMLPRSTKQLPLSKLNMAGIGPKMIRRVMQRKNVESLEQLMSAAQQAGVTMIACTMSMDIMGIKAEELRAGVNFGGVASYMGAAEDAGVNLFI